MDTTDAEDAQTTLTEDEIFEGALAASAGDARRAEDLICDLIEQLRAASASLPPRVFFGPTPAAPALITLRGALAETEVAARDALGRCGWVCSGG